MKTALVCLALTATLLTGGASAVAQEYDPYEFVYVCYWSGEQWLVASQYRDNAEWMAEYGYVVYADAFGSCPTSTPWALGLDSTPQAGYCSWHTGEGNPGQGWYLSIGPADVVAERIADEADGTDVWLEWDGTCPDWPAPDWRYGEWSDEVGVVHYPE